MNDDGCEPGAGVFHMSIAASESKSAPGYKYDKTKTTWILDKS